MKKYIGIDPGASGFIAVIDPVEDLCTFLSIAEHTPQEVSEFIGETAFGCNVTVVIEDVHSLYGSSAKSTFNFGYIKGMLVGFLVAHHIPYTLVQPKEWQTDMWTNADKTMRKKSKIKDGKNTSRLMVDTKATSIKAAQRLFPNVDLRRNERCKTIDDNKADALLMAEYGRRKNF